MRNPERFSVITADVVGSSKAADFRNLRDEKLSKINALHAEQERILTPYAITAWDEFQVVLSGLEHTPRVLFDLRRTFYPLHLWIAVGIGAAIGVYMEPVNVHGGGEAFLRARKAADRLKSSSPKDRALTSFESGNEQFDTIANTIYRLQDSLLKRITRKQWEAINMRLETGLLEETAERLNLDDSTVSRTLKRGSYSLLLETVNTMELVIRTLL